ncbi:MAG: T9SS type A sorting domain-containing protein [Bacteroidota bacterium]
MKTLKILTIALIWLLAYPGVSQTNDINTSTYDAFGKFIKVSNNEAIYFYREGTSHVPYSSASNGKIVARKYNYDTDTWGSKWTVYDDPNYDERNISGGLNEAGDKIIIHFAQYKYSDSSNPFHYMKFMISTDLNGTSWGSPQTTLDNKTSKIYDAFSPSGHIVELDNGDLLQPWYGRGYLGTGNYFCKIMRSTNGGTSWNLNYATIYDGSNFYGEPFIEYLGDNKLSAVARNNHSPYNLGISTSSNNGLSWLSMTATNISTSSGTVMPYTRYNPTTGRILCAVMDRGADKISLYKTTKWQLLENRTNCWSFVEQIDSGFDVPGYANILFFDINEYYTIYSKSVSSSDADTWGHAFTDEYNGPTSNTSTYDAFGLQVKVSDYESIYFYREGYKHVGTNSGRIMARKYNYLTNSWSAAWLVFDDPNLDDRNIAGGLNATGDKIILNFTQYNASTQFFMNIRTLVSSNLTGAAGTWTLQPTAAFTNTNPKAAFSPHGHIVKLDNGDLLQGWFIREGTDAAQYGPFKLRLMRSTDNGLTWNAFYATIYSGGTFYLGEPYIENLGNGKLVCIARNNNVSSGLYRVGIIQSNNNGVSWQPYQFTNITGTGHILPYTYYDEHNELMICTALDRGTQKYNFYTTTKSELIANPTSCWDLEFEIDNGFTYNGYASTVQFGKGNYFTTYARQTATTDCDTRSFFWSYADGPFGPVTSSAMGGNSIGPLSGEILGDLDGPGLVTPDSETKKRVLQDFVIYPNPATDELNILFNREVGQFSVSLKNLIGKEQPVEHQFSSNGIRLFTNQLTEGAYLLEIMADGIVFRQKVLVER